MSRLNWYKIEKGEITVLLGAYLSAAHIFQQTGGASEYWIAVRIHLSDFSQLRKFAWQVTDVDTLSPAEALDVYERNWRHLDESVLVDEGRKLINGLKMVLNSGVRSVTT